MVKNVTMKNGTRTKYTQPRKGRKKAAEHEYALVNTHDQYGRRWPNLPVTERCSKCGQPDNCGDCNHTALHPLEVIELGGIPAAADHSEQICVGDVIDILEVLAENKNDLAQYRR
jgi:hypothetical protein